MHSFSSSPAAALFKPSVLSAALALLLPVAAHALNEVVQFSSSVTQNVAEGSTTSVVTLSVTCSGGNSYGGNLTVNFATANGTAVSGSDYTATSGVLSFTGPQCNGAGTIKTIPVTIVGDLIVEPNESFTVTLSNLVDATFAGGPGLPAALGANRVTTVNIINDDHALSVGDLMQSEGNAGTTVFNVPVTCSGATAGYGGNVTVNFRTADGTATAGSDYVAIAAYGGLAFTNSECDAGTTKFIPVTVNGDTLFEGNETFTVILSQPVNAQITKGVAIVTIANDDAAVVAAPVVPVPTLGVGGLASLIGLMGVLGGMALRAMPFARRRLFRT